MKTALPVPLPYHPPAKHADIRRRQEESLCVTLCVLLAVVSAGMGLWYAATDLLSVRTPAA